MCMPRHLASDEIAFRRKPNRILFCSLFVWRLASDEILSGPLTRQVSPLQVHMQGYDGKHYCPRMASMNKPAYAAILDYSRDAPVIVFVSSRRQTRLTALDLAQHSMAADSPRQFIRMDDDELQGALSQVKDANLKHTLTFGIGLHHAGIADPRTGKIPTGPGGQPGMDFKGLNLLGPAREQRRHVA